MKLHLYWDTGRSFRPSCGLGFGVRTASVWLHSADQAARPAQIQGSGEGGSTSGQEEWQSHIAEEFALKICGH